MQQPSDGVPPQILPHVHLVSSYRFPAYPQHNLERAVDYLINAPKITRENSPMNWMFLLEPPQDGTMMLVWQPGQLGTQMASDGYVWADAESAFSQDKHGFRVEMYVHKSGFRPNEQFSTHARHRYRLTHGGAPSPNPVPVDSSLWIVHYHQADPTNQYPSANIQILDQVRHSMGQRRFLQQQGQLVRKEFMLHDRDNWPHINLPGNTAPPYAQQAMGYPGNVMAHMSRSHHPAYLQQQQAAVSQGAIGPSPAKRPRYVPPSHAHVSATAIPAPVVMQESAFEDEDGGSGGDYMDFLTPRDISLNRYVQHHEWLEEVLSSPFNTRQILPGELGLGRKGELESLTKDFFDAPTAETPRKALADPLLVDAEHAKSGKPAVQPGPPIPRIGRLEAGKAEDFTKCASLRMAEINAEMEKLKRKHAGRMTKLNKGRTLREAEQEVRLATLDLINGDAMKSGADIEGKAYAFASKIEADLGKQIKPLKEVECVQKGGLEDKLHTGNGSDQDFDMVDTFGNANDVQPQASSHPIPHSGVHSIRESNIVQASKTNAAKAAIARTSDIAANKTHRANTASEFFNIDAEDWIVVDKDGDSAAPEEDNPDLNSFANDESMQNPIDDTMGDILQDFVRGEPDDLEGNFDANDFGEGIDFGNLDTAGDALSGYAEDIENMGAEEQEEQEEQGLHGSTIENAYQDPEENPSPMDQMPGL